MVRGRAIDLSVLGQFPNLEMIQVSLNTFDANHWSFVADSKSLRSLEVLNGHCDDSIVNWIKQNKSLRKFSTNQCGVMTDAGVIELSQCEHLDSLAIEGTSLKERLGDFLTADLQKRLDGKIVLVEFWGTWCGPCLNFIPELERLQEKFGERGFEILAIHSKTGSETVESYLEQNPKRWPNLIDKDGKLRESFAVPSYPSIYIFGNDGKMRIALSYRRALSQSLELLLNDSR